MYAKAQYRKMGYFDGFVRKAVVVIPPHHELRKRTAMRNKEMGDPVPEDALNAMKGEEGWDEKGAGARRELRGEEGWDEKGAGARRELRGEEGWDKKGAGARRELRGERWRVKNVSV